MTNTPVKSPATLFRVGDVTFDLLALPHDPVFLTKLVQAFEALPAAAESNPGQYLDFSNLVAALAPPDRLRVRTFPPDAYVKKLEEVLTENGRLRGLLGAALGALRGVQARAADDETLSQAWADQAVAGIARTLAGALSIEDAPPGAGD